MEKLIVGSRGSKLALWQADWVKERLQAAGHSVEIKTIRTTGDRLPLSSLSEPGTKGLFVREIEEALAGGAIDLAVHSLKDLPVEQPHDLELAAIPVRDDARDVLVSREKLPLSELPLAARLSTSSTRRQSQLRSLRPDLCLAPIRGNVDTRIRKMQAGACDGVVLAAAGLHRLGLASLITQYFSPSEICPAVGQGALAVEIRRGDHRVKRALQTLDDSETRTAVDAERTVLRLLGGGCQSPIAVYAQITGDQLVIRGVVASPDGSRLIRAQTEKPVGEVDAATKRLAASLIKQGAEAILQIR
jgi:hydroxymethylbilane synthase